jgi:serine/threonine protein phosphatase 1
MKPRTLVIGDIHGGLKGLIQVMERANVTQNDTLIFLGDYVDGWSESAQVVQFLIELEQNQHCIFIKGNHDDYCEEWLREGELDKHWIFHGGASTLKSYENIPDNEQLMHLNFFERMKLYHVDEQNRLFLHAGFTSMNGPSHEFHSSNYKWDRTLWEMALTMDKHIKKDSKFYPKRLLQFNEIYIGHTPTLNYDITTPMQGCNVWNVDTGAAFWGSLTMMDIDTKEFWQSDALLSLYPNEKGRNK